MRRSILAIASLATLGLNAAPAAYAQSNAPSANFVGLGVGVLPRYEGSSDYRAIPVPFINYHAGSFFITPRAGLPAMGFKTTLAPDLEAGVFLGLNLGRKADKTDRTDGLDDIKFHGAYGAFIEWAPGRYSLGAAYRQSMRSGYGGTLELRASYLALKTEQHAVRVGVSTQWANRDTMQTWFGVTSGQALRSKAGLSAYSPSSGFKSASLFSTWSYRINQNWSTLTTLGVDTVLGDARKSPLTEKKANVFGAVGVIYHF